MQYLEESEVSLKRPLLNVAKSQKATCICEMNVVLGAMLLVQ